MNFTAHKLTNGLDLILAPLESTQTVTVLFLVKTGSKYEKKSESGLSHFLEHMFFKGTEKRPTTLAISEELDKVGGIYNAFTGKECTAFYIKLAHIYLPLALDVLSDMLINSNFESQEIKKEKGVILEEIKLYQDTPTAYIDELFEKLLYGDTPSGRQIIGTKETVASFSQQDIKQYLANHYSAKNSLLIVAGKIEPGIVLAKVKQYFSSYPTQNIVNKEKVIEQQSAPGLTVFYKKTDQTHLCLGVRTFDLFNKRKYSLALLDTILGGGMSSRLFIKIRDQQGLAYYIKSAQESYTDSGYLMVQAGIRHQNVEKVVKLILKELELLKDKLVDEKELKKAKEHIKGITLLHLETSDQIASFLGTQKLLENKIEEPETIFKKLDQVSAHDLRDLSREIFVSGKLNLALINPLKNQKTSLGKILKFN